MPTDRSGSPRLLLDTHVWLWTLEGVGGKFSEGCLAQLRQASPYGLLWVSVISVWEIATLESLGRLSLSRPCEEWVSEALAATGMNLAEVTSEIAVGSARLSRQLLADPADRILVATARHLNATLVTADRAILAYGSRGHLNVMDAGN